MLTKAITVEGLQKSFGDHQALYGLSFAVNEGEVYGLLGPHGAGKSTLFHILLGFMRPSAGWIELLGSPELEQVRSRIGYLPERSRYHTRYSASEYLRFLGAFDDIGGAVLRDRIEAALRRVGLADDADRQLSTFSRSMLQRLGIAQALLNDPDLLLLDEPFTGLDPAGQSEILELLRDLRSDRRTILIATPYFAPMEQICDRIGVIVHGQLVTEVDAIQLRQPANSIRITLERLSPTLANQLHQLGPAVVCSEREVLLRPNSPPLQAAVLHALLDANAMIVALVPQERPLERLYLQAIRGDAVETPTNGVLEPLPANTPAVAVDLPAPNPATEPDEPPPPIPQPPKTPLTPPPQPVNQDQYRPNEGDTLLRELLRRDRDPSDPS